MTKDPVCGMNVREDSLQRIEHNGHVYCFCSDDCKDRFLADPAKYEEMVQEPAGVEGHSHRSHRHGCGCC